MRTRSGKLFLNLFLVLTCYAAHSQSRHTVKGRITDAASGDPVPFASIAIKGTTFGCSTDFDGFYSLNFSPPVDSIWVSCIGYATKSKALTSDSAVQVIDLQLVASAQQLKEVRIFAGENPAWAIMRRVVAGREKNNMENLSGYEYESYNKIQIDIDNLSEKFRNKRSIRKMTHIVEKYDEVKGEDGQTIIPIFISESSSNVYSRSNPAKKKEIINKTKISGIGLTDGSFVSQIVGSSFQQYNFYKNWLKVLEKDFVSPISDSWKLYYDFYLADSVANGVYYDYQIDFEPKHEQDLAFRGTFWVDGKSYALTQIDANVGKSANLNFIEKIKIQASYDLFENEQTWVRTKTRVLIDVDEPTKQAAGLLIKFYSSNSNYKLGAPKDPKFFDSAIELKEDYMQPDSAFWDRVRPESLTKSEVLSFSLVDSLKVLPVVKTYTEILNVLVNGYKRIDSWKIDIGPYLFAYAHNNLEGHRLRIGFRTDPEFSRKWIISGFGAYGFRDNKFKYGLGADYIFSRKPWTMAGVSYSKDLEQLGLSAESLGGNTLFAAFARFGTLRRAYWQQDVSAYFKREILKGLTTTVQLLNRSFDPLFAFAYPEQPGLGADSPLKRTYEVTELSLETRVARNETFLQNDNDRISLGTGNSPAFTFRYSMGIRNFLGGDFNYHKFSANVKQSFRFGALGRTDYQLAVGYIPTTIPYTLLYAPLGNQSVFYLGTAFNLMRYFEFVSDRYVTLRIEHNDGGFVFNRIPAVRKLKWRLLATGRIFYGQLSSANRSLALQTNSETSFSRTFTDLGNTPYLEVGYGIDNILKFGRIDAIHRLTFRQHPDVTRFAVKMSFWFNL